MNKEKLIKSINDYVDTLDIKEKAEFMQKIQMTVEQSKEEYLYSMLSEEITRIVLNTIEEKKIKKTSIETYHTIS